MRVSRRTLLASLAPSLAAALCANKPLLAGPARTGAQRGAAADATPRAPRPYPIRIGVLQQAELPGRLASVARGLELGLTEAAQTAVLVGAAIERTVVDVRTAAEAEAQVAALASLHAQAVITALAGEAAVAASRALEASPMVHLPLGASAIAWGGGAPRRFFVPLDGSGRARALAAALAASDVRRVAVCTQAQLASVVPVLFAALEEAGLEPASSGVCGGAEQLKEQLRSAAAQGTQALVLAWPGYLPHEVAEELDRWHERPLVGLVLGPDTPDLVMGSAIWAVDWFSGLTQYGAAQLNERFERRFSTAMDGAGWTGWAAVKAVTEAALRSRPESPGALAEALRTLAFDGHKGLPLRFGEDGRLQQPSYVVGRLPGDDAGPPRLVYQTDTEAAA